MKTHMGVSGLVLRDGRPAVRLRAVVQQLLRRRQWEEVWMSPVSRRRRLLSLTLRRVA